MTKEFKVAYLGVKTFTDPSVETYDGWNDHLWIYVYTLPAEKILHIVENVGKRGLNDVQCGIKPEFEFGEMMGGRFFPAVGRKAMLRMPLSADEAWSKQDTPASQWLDTITNSSSTTSGRGRWKRKSKKKPQALQAIVIGDLQHGGMEMDTGLNELKNALRRDELVTTIVTPMKETVIAGKSLVQIGQSFANWVSKLVGAQ